LETTYHFLGVGVDDLAVRLPPHSKLNFEYILIVTHLRQTSTSTFQYNYYCNIIITEQLFAPVKGECNMTPKEELLDFISNLSEEQVEKLFNHLLELSASLEESSLPCPLEQTLQTA
jgi:tRNA(Phe) wybutosine-synthesizing methylase Tyw3